MGTQPRPRRRTRPGGRPRQVSALANPDASGGGHLLLGCLVPLVLLAGRARGVPQEACHAPDDLVRRDQFRSRDFSELGLSGGSWLMVASRRVTRGLWSFLRQATATWVRAVLGSILRKATPLRRMRRILAGARETPRPVSTRAHTVCHSTACWTICGVNPAAVHRPMIWSYSVGPTVRGSSTKG